MTRGRCERGADLHQVAFSGGPRINGEIGPHRDSSSSANRQGAPFFGPSQYCSDLLKRVRSPGLPLPGGCAQYGTTHQHNTHIRDVRQVCYPWHPWHGRTVQVRADLVKRSQPVAYCSLEDVPTCRVLEVPLWMLDVAACCKTRVSKPGFASAQSLRELKEVLQSARPQAQGHSTPDTQRRYSLDAGGANGSIAGPEEIEPTPVVRSSPWQPTLDRAIARGSTKDSAIGGAVTEATSSHSGRNGNRTGGAR